jgi:hypothetical protein
MEAVIQDMQHRYDAHETAAAQALAATQVAEAKAAQQLVDAQAEAMSLRAAEVGPGTECSLIGEREERERDASVCIRRHQDARCPLIGCHSTQEARGIPIHAFDDVTSNIRQAPRRDGGVVEVR